MTLCKQPISLCICLFLEMHFRKWRHNEHPGVSNLLRRRSKKISKLRVTALCENNPPVTGVFPSQRVRDAEYDSIWWLYHGKYLFLIWVWFFGLEYFACLSFLSIIESYDMEISWWRHQMETFSALLAICAGNSPVTGQMPVTWSFGAFFDLLLNKRLSKKWWD